MTPEAENVNIDVSVDNQFPDPPDYISELRKSFERMRGFMGAEVRDFLALEDLRLKKLGIVPDLHAGYDEATYAANPNLIAGWMLGMLRAIHAKPRDYGLDRMSIIRTMNEWGQTANKFLEQIDQLTNQNENKENN